MVPSSDNKPPAFQDFESEDGKPLSKLPVHACPETDQESHPLRIDNHAGYAYRVIFRDRQGPQPPMLEFEQMYRTCRAVLEDLEVEKTSDREDFLEMLGNVRYHYSKMLDYLAVLLEIGIKVKADGKTEDQIRSEFQESQHKMELLDYENTCVHVLRRHSNFPAPCRFVVLPADLGSWDNSDPTTHNFRLYFLCDINKGESTVSDLPEHKHFANHPGFILVRPQEFFQTYGRYILIFLKMLRNGFSERTHEIPRLDTFKILWGFDVGNSGNHLTKDTIEPLVSKAIGYLEGLSLPRRGSEKWLTERESVAAQDFLVVPDGSNALGGLYRYTAKDDYWTWVCKQHAHDWLAPGTLETLVDFVEACGGTVDTQEATLRIELQSQQHADQFCVLLNGTEQRFHVSIKLGWRDVSHEGLDKILQETANAKVQHLEIDGVPYGIHPHGPVDYKTDIFASFILRNKEVRSVTLLNYPRPQEQFTYVDVWEQAVYMLHSKQQQIMTTKHWWMCLRNKTHEFVGRIMGHRRNSVFMRSQNLQNFMANEGYGPVSSVSSFETECHGEYDLEECILRELHLYELSVLGEIPKVWGTTVVFQALESLRTLTLDVADPIIDRDVAHIVQKCPKLRELNISLKHAHVLEQVQRTLDMWQGRQDSLQLTLLERGELGQGRIVARVIVSGRTSYHSGSSNLDRPGTNTDFSDSLERKQGMAGKVEFLQWDSDHVTTSLTDLTAALLDVATAQNPSVMYSLSLDISRVSKGGLAHVRNILQRSTLGHLHIRCTPFDPFLADFVRGILLSVQWSTLQSLVLTDTAVNDWIPLLDGVREEEVSPSSFGFDLQLQSLEIRGSDKSLVYLSHSNMLFIYQLLHLNPQMELVLQNVSPELEGGFDLVVELLQSRE
ncbi:hypothetical protein BG003_011619 [Podila horticola]|nr:hypothetical protein BG003_011619 [Podila horticola]